MPELEKIRSHRSFGGEQAVFRHASRATGTAMEFSLFLPPRAANGPCPVLFYLSGLTCTWANVTEKGGFQRVASELGLIIVCPDTSPRGTDLPGEHEAYDFGSGAGFYLDATDEPWSRHYRMAAYVEHELPALLADGFPGGRHDPAWPVRPFHGRARRTDAGLPAARALPLALGLLPHRRPEPGSVGTQGSCRLSRPR